MRTVYLICEDRHVEALKPRGYVKMDSQEERSRRLLKLHVFMFILLLMPVLRPAKEEVDQDI